MMVLKSYLPYPTELRKYEHFTYHITRYYQCTPRDAHLDKVIH